MKKENKWQKPEAGVLTRSKTKKNVGSSRKGAVRYGTGLGPIPPVPPAIPDLV